MAEFEMFIVLYIMLISLMIMTILFSSGLREEHKEIKEELQEIKKMVGEGK